MLHRFKSCGLVVGLLLLTLTTSVPQELELDVGQVITAAQEWAENNLDEGVLRSLPEVDRDKVEKFLRQFQDQLQNDYVLELATLNETAKFVLPLLDAYPETQPYAAWLRSRLDYFEVAEELRKQAPTPKPVPGQRPKPGRNPSSSVERKAWALKLGQSARPPAANALVPKLKSIFARERVPEQLVWVAEVESGFNARARSPAGAGGLFQLMPATAKELGLRRWPFDQRYQVEPSAQGAARYLKRLHTQFGDWRLALAAYNAGEGKVQGLLKRSATRSFDSIATALPAETQMFVPKVEATILRREGVSLAKLRPPKDRP
ncbi:MAG: lytic transglycosylase domain-containing protein [Verrucomicrobia subdivision 3 bacterium]|nr:lytic transglycosylase domain-containing protein [Limisphaerales bacterium]